MARIPGLEKQLAEAEAREGEALVSEAVRPEQIAEVVERWTGHSRRAGCWKASGKSCCGWKRSWASA